mmetsp:Transcript_3375/g.4776  ORF Transcript_3375/g.4776 Transcript_3375/m.4776 type:complete len:82 (+) Transcript_3375:465-710(+)
MSISIKLFGSTSSLSLEDSSKLILNALEDNIIGSRQIEILLQVFLLLFGADFIVAAPRAVKEATDWQNTNINTELIEMFII